MLVKSGYNNNFVQYKSKGDKILSIQEYLSLIGKYLKKLMNQYKKESEWKIQLIVCFYHVTYSFQSESTLYSCLNVKELLARSRREI